MSFLILIGVVLVVGLVSYKMILSKLDQTSKELKEKNMKDYDKYHNKLEELNLKIKELDSIGIKEYSNKFIWDKFKDSFFLKLAFIAPIVSSFVITAQHFETIYHSISLLIGLGFVSLALLLYRVVNVEKYAKEGSNEFLKLITLYKTEYINTEYNKITSAIKALSNTTPYTLTSLDLLKNFNKLYSDILDVIAKQSNMNDNLKTSLLETVNNAFKQGIDVAKDIYDILLVEDKIDRKNMSELLKEKSDKNIDDFKQLVVVMGKINESLAITVLDIPKVSSDKSSIEDANVSLKSLEDSMEQAMLVTNSLKEFGLKIKH